MFLHASRRFRTLYTLRYTSARALQGWYLMRQKGWLINKSYSEMVQSHYSTLPEGPFKKRHNLCYKKKKILALMLMEKVKNVDVYIG
jgi:hypothetical protein